ncbi:PREDICTED: coiled-coil domain-containing protein 138-like [Branchiostoma belcheri]|uniref:Coiled-coil domain-containing protein 138-like n=1 Tax=Branchiostoma belcheri TaxID=7741 RepID=A0A6P4XYU2_BRABE|nr:PREDICTED: coiled-coil domain-containing protein 138-like [Branchiostoma belcheri]XP_019621791.1 PREDICTED: coiled-coil domain-containing protein 138-like [Branchiostoma belcheri]XP_019621792.1 PREDICTED: coiled-coil domain-containing protein 138-like [Branchiostoma belcheri]
MASSEESDIYAESVAETKRRKEKRKTSARLFGDVLSSAPSSSRSQGLSDTQRSNRSPRRSKSRFSPEGLTSSERKYYNRALKDLYEIIKISSNKLDLSESMEEPDRHGDYQGTDGDYSQDPTVLEEEETFMPTESLTIPTLRSSLSSQNDEDFDPLSVRRFHRKHSARRREDRTSPGNVKKIYKELVSINNKLQEENALLHERQEELGRRELLVLERERALDEIEEQHGDLNKHWAIMQHKHKRELGQWEEALKERTKENKRLQHSFEVMKQANDQLRKQLTESQESKKKLEAQASSLERRVVNLQRKHQFAERQKGVENIPPPQPADTKPAKPVKEPPSKGTESAVAKPKPSGLLEILAVLLDWVCEANLQQQQQSDGRSTPLISLPAPELIQDRCIKVLPHLSELLHQVSTGHTKLHLPCLQFVFWAMFNLQQSDKQHVLLSATYRRLGEELYRPTVVRFTEGEKSPGGTVHSPRGGKPRTGVYFKSSNLQVRLLSALIILKTLLQVDYLAQVFDVLRNDLRLEKCKELFLHYQGVQVILPFIKGGNKALMGSAVDILLQLSTESAMLPRFLDSCSNESWFRACALLLRTPNLDMKVLEKLSIILQKLSKIKANKKYFEVFTIGNMLQETYRTCDPQQEFLALNLRSILHNLGMIKPH